MIKTFSRSTLILSVDTINPRYLVLQTLNSYLQISAQRPVARRRLSTCFTCTLYSSTSSKQIRILSKQAVQKTSRQLKRILFINLQQVARLFVSLKGSTLYLYILYQVLNVVSSLESGYIQIQQNAYQILSLVYIFALFRYTRVLLIRRSRQQSFQVIRLSF